MDKMCVPNLHCELKCFGQEIIKKPFSSQDALNYSAICSYFGHTGVCKHGQLQGRRDGFICLSL